MAVAALFMLACATSRPGRRVTVRVEDEGGQPLAGARIQASLAHDLLVWNLFQGGCSASELANGETDPGGTFSFTVDHPPVRRNFCRGSSVRVSYRDWPDHYAQLETDPFGVIRGGERPALLDERTDHANGGTTLVVRLGPAMTARGTVRWDEQPGCKEAPEVFAYEVFDGGVGVLRGRARVDAGGAFALTGLGTGRVSIVTRYCGITEKRAFDRRSGAPVEVEIPTRDAAP